jgi:hypothetical protein
MIEMGSSAILNSRGLSVKILPGCLIDDLQSPQTLGHELDRRQWPNQPHIALFEDPLHRRDNCGVIIRRIEKSADDVQEGGLDHRPAAYWYCGAFSKLHPMAFLPRISIVAY